MSVEFGNQALLGIQIGDKEIDFSDDYVIGIHLSESLTEMLPTVKIDFRDKRYTLLEQLGLTPQDKLKLQFGKSYDNSYNLEFDFFSIRDVQYQSQMSAVLPVFFILSGWELFFKETYRRGWYQDTASNVVSDIVAEGGWEPDVENSTDSSNYIQANWTNAMMIRRMSRYAKNTWGDEGYVYGLKRDGKFLFKSYEKLWRDKKVVELELNSLTVENEDSINKIYNWGLKGSPRFLALKGAYGVQRQGFDLANKTYREAKFNIDNLNYSNFAGERYINDNEIGEYKDCYSFDWNTTKKIASSNIMQTVSNLITLEIITNFNNEIELGKIANISIVGQTEKGKASEMLSFVSGKWLVSGINTFYTSKSNIPVSKVTMIRDGIDKRR